MRFDFSTSLLITFRNNEKIYRLFLYIYAIQSDSEVIN